MSEKTGYKPTAGMQSAARRALKLKEDGKANGAGTAVGWTRARQLANGETLSLSTVKRMYSFFSRHEVDKKGKDWNNSENPSNGKIMWLAWGGDAGYSWSRKIVEREKNVKKSADEGNLIHELAETIDDIINPFTKVIEMEDDPEDYESENEEEDKWDNMQKACWKGYKQVGTKEKNGRQVPNCVPIKKSIFGTEGPQTLVPRNKGGNQTASYHYRYTYFNRCMGKCLYKYTAS